MVSLKRVTKGIGHHGLEIIKSNLGTGEDRNEGDGIGVHAAIGDGIAGAFLMGYEGLKNASFELAKYLSVSKTVTPQNFNPVLDCALPSVAIGLAVGATIGIVNGTFIAPLVHDYVSKWRCERKLGRKMDLYEYYKLIEKK